MNTETPKTNTDKPNIEHLRDIAIYLSGYEKGRGDLLPLGNWHLRTLWDAIEFIRKSKPL